MPRRQHFITAMAMMVLGLVHSAAIPPVRGGDNNELEAATDSSLFPKAYGVLANEKLMFPVDMRDWPVKINGQRQLLVDDYLIATAQNVTRTVHQAKKLADNPIMTDHTPWDGRGPVFPIVMRDEVNGTFRMWYTGNVVYNLPSGTRVRFPALYAESNDGIRWTRPELGLHEFNGSKANNIVIPAGNLYGLHFDKGDPDPQRRFKGIVWHEPEYVPREGYYLYTSRDGIHWKRQREEPLAISLHGYTMPQSGIGDTSIFRWDHHLNKYVGDVKFVLPGKMRSRGFMESDDLIHWTAPRMTIYPDSLDESDSQIYAQNSFCYESMWLGFLRVMHTERTKGYKQTTVELTASRDGRHWYRVGRREETIPLGSEEQWDTDYHDPFWEPVAVGDELWIYYRSGKLRRDQKRRCDLGVAKLRRDGFVSLDAGSDPGTIVTRPLAFAGNRLFVNAEVSEGGYVKAAVLTREQKPVEDRTLVDAIPVTQGGVTVPVTWKNTGKIAKRSGEHTCIGFELKNARLYSFWIE